MQIIKTEEVTVQGNVYIVNTYDNGTVEKYIKPDPNYQPPPQPPQPKPVTNEELRDLVLDAMQGTTDLYLAQEENKQLQLDIMQGITDLYMMQASATDNTQGGM